MNKIKDRVSLSIFAGGIGALVMTIIDEISLRRGLSQRAYRTTAAGVWVSTRKEAESPAGQLVGSIMNLGLCMVGAFGLIQILTKHGRDHSLLKGSFYGISMGGVIQAILSGFSENKVSPKDAVSNLSYIVSNAAYGLTTAWIAAKCGHDSLFDTQPEIDWIKSTEETIKETRLVNH